VDSGKKVRGGSMSGEGDSQKRKEQPRARNQQEVRKSGAGTKMNGYRNEGSVIERRRRRKKFVERG